MKKLFLTLVSILSLLNINIKANEGMWLMMLINRLNYVDMQNEGLKITSDEIYSVNKSSMKDAVVRFGSGCTGAVISDKGLILTNHHCGVESIATLSKPETNYLKDGFWAKDNSQEIPVKGLSVRFLVRMDDASDRINNLIIGKRLTETERNNIIDSEIEKIKQENSENGKYIVEVKSFYEENEFYYFVYKDYKDIRFVGAPPSSIGKFGGDTDNWEWPRHTGDFSLFRVYTNANGEPAEYSENNIPLAPKYSFSISLNGVNNNDFTMTLGYPGNTKRFLSSYGTQQLANYELPAFIDASKKTMDIVKGYMDKDSKVAIDYTSKYSNYSNYWKNRIGMMRAIYRNNIVAEKSKTEEGFIRWSSQNIDKRRLYGDVLYDMRVYYTASKDEVISKTYLNWMLKTSAYAYIPSKLVDKIENYLKTNSNPKDEDLIKIVENSYSNIDIKLERDLYAELAATLKDKSTKSYRPVYFHNNFAGIYASQDLKIAMIQLATKSAFKDKESVIKLLKNNNKESIVSLLKEDQLYILSKDFKDHSTIKEAAIDKLYDRYMESNRLYAKGFKIAYSKYKFAPDANMTMRMSYGKVRGIYNFEEKKEAHQNYYTTLDGVIAKYKKDDPEFDIPTKLINLYDTKSYGRYADSNGKIRVNFISNNDITGGNSGSPVINGNGELVGVAFDSNMEGVSGDLKFNADQRAISCDIKYILFIIDKFAGADNLIKEMKISK